MYRAGIADVDQRPASIKADSCAPAALRFWAMPTRMEWPLNPSPSPAASAAARTLRPIWLAERPKTGVPGP